MRCMRRCMAVMSGGRRRKPPADPPCFVCLCAGVYRYVLARDRVWDSGRSALEYDGSASAFVSATCPPTERGTASAAEP